MTTTSPGPFLIVFSGSTGSTWLVDQLRKRDDVLVEGEALAPHKSPDEQRRYVDDFFTRAGPAARGFKAKVFQVADPADLREALDRHRVTFVHLERTNRVKQAISLITSDALGDKAEQLTGKRQANLRKGDLERTPELAIGRINVDLRQLRHTLEEIEAREADVRRFSEGSNQEHLTYEQLLADPAAFYDRFCDAVGLPRRAPAESSLVKKTGDDLHETIANFDECLAALRGTPYEDQLP